MLRLRGDDMIVQLVARTRGGVDSRVCESIALLEGGGGRGGRVGPVVGIRAAAAAAAAAVRVVIWLCLRLRLRLRPREFGIWLMLLLKRRRGLLLVLRRRGINGGGDATFILSLCCSVDVVVWYGGRRRGIGVQVERGNGAQLMVRFSQVT